MKEKNFDITLNKIRNSEEEKKNNKEALLEGIKALIYAFMSGALLVSLFLFSSLILVCVGLFLFCYMAFCAVKKHESFERRARTNDREYFIKCVMSAKTEEDLEKAGFSDLINHPIFVNKSANK